jgi:subtilase family serine protease
MMRRTGGARGERTVGRAGSPFGIACTLTAAGLLLALAACGAKGGGDGTTSGAGESGVDLAISSISFSPSQANVGEQVHVIDVIQNAGDAQSAPSQVEIYLSADPFVTSADVLIGLRSVGTLDPGEVSSGGGFLTIPSVVTEGDWHLGVIVDGPGVVVETDESNNVQVALQPLSVSSAPAPDLVPTQVSFDPPVIEAGQLLTITDRVENHGEGSATSFQVGVYLSQDATITSGDLLLGLRSVPSLAPGELSFVSAPVTVPASTAAGTWFVGSLADVGGTQSESDEFNNGLTASSPLTVTTPPRPDLRMSQLEFSPAELDVGQALSVSEEVLNQGLMPAGPFRVGIYLSSDDQLTVDDHLIGFRALAGLGIGEASSVAAPVVVPASVGAGTFHVGAIADHEGLVVESDEDNNGAIALGTVVVHVPPLPDLVTSAVSFSPGVVASGEIVTVMERVENRGTASSGTFRVGTYLSNNPTVSTSDVLLGTRTVGGLEVGQISESVSEFSLPPGIATGSWTVGVIADDLSGVQESDEGDNLLIAPGLLDITGGDDPLPDLLVETLSAGPSSVLQGGTLLVSSLVRNQGELSAPSFGVSFYLSEDAVIDVTDYLVGSRTIFSLGIGGGSAQSFPYTLDASLPLGTYRFGALCDEFNVVLESDEENNVSLLPGTIEIYVPPPPAPDLTLTELAFDPASLAVGESLQLTGTLKNVGDLDAGVHHVDYYLSDDEEVTSADTLLGSGLSAPSLASGAEAPAVIDLVVPAELAPGTWHVGAIVSIDSGEPDSDPTNDLRVAESTLEVTP